MHHSSSVAIAEILTIDLFAQRVVSLPEPDDDDMDSAFALVS